MTKAPILSVLMTAYNRDWCIAKSIESVLSSSFSDFELIIVDDCSEDDTVAIIRKYEKIDNRIKWYSNEINLGDYPNRNKAATYALGKYIQYVDSDDTIYSHTLETMVSCMEQFPNAGFGLGLPENSPTLQPPLLLNARDAFLLNYRTLPIFFASPGNAIFNREAFWKMNGFNATRMVSDFEMWHRMVLRFPVVMMPANLYKYNVHGEQEVKDFSRYLTQYEQIKINYLLAPDSPLSIKEGKEIIGRRKISLLKIIIRFIIYGKWRSAGHRINVLMFYLKTNRNES